MGLAGSLPVVKRLLMRKPCVGIEHMDYTGHILVHQANKFKIANLRKSHRKRLSADDRRSRHTCGPIEGCGAERKSRAADRERRAALRIRQECDGMNFINYRGPADAVPGMNPNFIRQKRERLASLILALSSYGRTPVGAKCWCQCQRGQKYSKYPT